MTPWTGRDGGTAVLAPATMRRRSLAAGWWWDRLVAVVARWRRRARQRRELAQLPARLLRDIGVSEEQAAAEARKPFWRP